MRQPFLKHISDDDFVTAYLGYDDVQSLDKLRLSSLAILNFVLRGFHDIDWGKRYLVLKIIFEVLSIRHFKMKLKDFRRLMLDDETRFRTDEWRFMERVFGVAKSTDHVEDVNNRYRSRAMISLFMQYIGSRRGYAITWLPDPGPVVEAPVFMEDQEDVEGLLKAAALLFSLEGLTKASVWARRYPETIVTAPFTPKVSRVTARARTEQSQ